MFLISTSINTYYRFKTQKRLFFFDQCIKILIFNALIFTSCEYQTVEEVNQVQIKEGIYTDAIIVNIGELDRLGLSKLMSQVDGFKPKVIGLDVSFEEKKGFYEDSVLVNTIASIPNLVVAQHDNVSPGHKEITEGRSFFDKKVEGLHVGHTGLYSKDGMMNTGFLPAYYYQGRWYNNFAVEVALLADPNNTFEFLLKYLNEGNRGTYPVIFSYLPSQIPTLEHSELMKLDTSIIKDKIVLLGYTGPKLEDKHVTPLKGIIDESPDTYGIYILANILHQVLNMKLDNQDMRRLIGKDSRFVDR